MSELDHDNQMTVKAVPVELYLVKIIDSDGKPSVRLVTKVRGTSQFNFVHPKGVETSIKQPAKWVIKALEEAIGGTSGDAEQDAQATLLPMD